MLLKEYISKHSVSVTEFAKQIGARSRATVYRYMAENNANIPDAAIMQKIFEVTNGLVSANDFYNLKIKSKKSRSN